MKDLAHEDDYRRVVQAAATQFLPDSSIEIVRACAGVRPRHVLFDFDGTLSLIREGWPDVMAPMMVETLLATGTGESPAELERLAREFMMELNGKQTIYQMFRLAEEIRRRGGKPDDPLVYKQRYHQRLMQRIEQRREALRRGECTAEAWLVPHALPMLDDLRRRGVQLYLASGTDEQYVKEEVELLSLSGYFDGHVYGAVDDVNAFSKAMVIERILRENQIDGGALLGLGDGYVEIQNVKAVGGTAIAVASDEAGRSGKPDAWKRDRLVGVGADAVIADYREWPLLATYLFDGKADER